VYRDEEKKRKQKEKRKENQRFVTIQKAVG
jgi:hypothetical protein